MEPELEHLKDDVATAKGWMEKYLNWIIAGGCFALGVIVRHLV